MKYELLQQIMGQRGLAVGRRALPPTTSTTSAASGNLQEPTIAGGSSESRPRLDRQARAWPGQSDEDEPGTSQSMREAHAARKAAREFPVGLLAGVLARCPLRATRADALGHDDARRWREVVDLGWPAAALPEAMAGSRSASRGWQRCSADRAHAEATLLADARCSGGSPARAATTSSGNIGASTAAGGAGWRWLSTRRATIRRVRPPTAVPDGSWRRSSAAKAFVLDGMAELADRRRLLRWRAGRHRWSQHSFSLWTHATPGVAGSSAPGMVDGPASPRSAQLARRTHRHDDRSAGAGIGEAFGALDDAVPDTGRASPRHRSCRRRHHRAPLSARCPPAASVCSSGLPIGSF